MELIKQKQTEKQQQQRETKQQKTTKQKQKPNESKQPNKTRKTKQEQEKPNLPRITMYLTKSTSSIEARAAALKPVEQVNVTRQPSKDATSASSIGYNQSDGIQPEPQTKPNMGTLPRGYQHRRIHSIGYTELFLFVISNHRQRYMFL